MFADGTLDRERDIVARPGPFDRAVLDLHRPDRLDEVGRVALDVDPVTHRQRCRQPNRGHRQMRVPMSDCPDRVGGLVLLGGVALVKLGEGADADVSPEPLV